MPGAKMTRERGKKQKEGFMSAQGSTCFVSGDGLCSLFSGGDSPRE